MGRRGRHGHRRLYHVCGAPWASVRATPSEAAQVVAAHTEMAIAAVGHPAELANLSGECDNVDLAPTSLAPTRFRAHRQTRRGLKIRQPSSVLAMLRSHSRPVALILNSLLYWKICN